MQYHYLQKKYGFSGVMHKLLLIPSAFIREIMVSLQKRNNMRLNTIKYLLLFVSIFTSLTASADVEVNATNFPDRAFRNWILQNVSGASDGVLTDDEIAKVTSIDCNGTYENHGNIANLQGVEFFTALIHLYCGYNQLTALDVSKNTKLTGLSCYSNQLTTLDVSKNTALTHLDCFSNQLAALDVSKNTALTHLDCNNNQLTALDVSKNTALTLLDCYSNQLTSLDVSKNTALTHLDCFSNQLATLDVSNNTALTDLECNHNKLTSLDVSTNTALTIFMCHSNQLTSLDVSKNMALTHLWCYSNQLASLDVSGCTVLTSLLCLSNQLTSLDVSGCTALTSLQCSSNQLTSLDVNKNTALTILVCNSNQLMSLDLSNNNSINNTNTNIGSQSISLTAVTVSEGIAIPVLSDFEMSKVSNLKLNGTAVSSSITSVNGQLYLVFAPKGTAQSSIDGKKLTYTYSTGNSFSKAASMDVTVTLSYTPTTYSLSIQSGAGGSVSYDGTTITNKTQSFTVNEGTSATITISPNSGYRLSRLTVNGTNVTSNVSNNKYTINSITANTTVVATFEQIPSTGLEVNSTNFPDEAFRNWVLQKISGASDGVLTDEEISKVSSIVCYFRSISSLQGIEYFFALNRLECYGNQLTSLDVSKNTALTFLSCGSNQLTSLDVSKNTALTSLSCYSNQLTSLDVSKNTALTSLGCQSNQLTSLDVSKNTALTSLGCQSNQLTSLDVSKNTALIYLYCYSNQLTSLDVSKNTALTSLECYSNQLMSLDVSKNTALTSLYCSYNQLTSLDVSKNTALTRLVCGFNQLTSLDVSANTALIYLGCSSNQLLNLDLSNNNSINDTYTSIGSQTRSLTAVDISAGIAIPVPSDFDFSKVSNLKLNGTTVSGSITSVNGQKYLVFAPKGTAQSSIDGKELTYTYSTGNSFSQAASMDVTVTLSYIAPTCFLYIQSGSGGSVSYNGTTITNKTQSFTITEGSTASITVSPNNGYKLASLVVNGTDVTSGVENNQYTISNITANTTVVVTFKAISQSFSQDGINYEMRSTADYTLNVGKGNYSGHVVIPATVTYDGDTWTVAGVVDGAFNHSGITAITWNPRTVLSNSAFGSDMNPNMLVYVQSESYAPTNVQNIVANGRARKIVLTDAASGNDFNCPVAFTAEEISYTHRYSMTTGIGECRGWETIALPFDVKQFTHESKGALVPFKAYYRGSPNKPFWLYELSASGFVEAESIEAYTPYIISMPNNDHYDTAYHLSGRVTFAATNAKVGVTELKRPKSGDKTFVPNFSMQAATENIFPLNVNNDFFNNNEYYAEGSHFVKGSRHVLPFEAYMTTSTANAKGIIPIFETLPTAIREIPMQGVKGVRIYSLSGELIMFDENVSIEDALKWLKRGVYFVNGKKIVVKLSEK